MPIFLELALVRRKQEGIGGERECVHVHVCERGSEERERTHETAREREFYHEYTEERTNQSHHKTCTVRTTASGSDEILNEEKKLSPAPPIILSTEDIH